MPSDTYASSTFSESTTYSYSKDSSSSAPQTQSKRSKTQSFLKKAFKDTIRDIGRPPTYAYDQAHSIRAQSANQPDWTTSQTHQVHMTRH